MIDKIIPSKSIIYLMLILMIIENLCAQEIEASNHEILFDMDWGISEDERKIDFWGSFNYSLYAYDNKKFTDIEEWTGNQPGVFTMNMRSNNGFESVFDLTFDLDTINENIPSLGIEQLYITYSSQYFFSSTVGKQRLNWGTGNIFNAINKCEKRANPIDKSSILSGVSGVKFMFIPLDWFSFTTILIPEEELRWSQGAFRADISLYNIGLDFGLGAVKYTYSPWSDESVTDESYLFDNGPTVENMDRVAVFTDASLGIDDFVIYTENQLSWGREMGYWMPGMTLAEDLVDNGRDEFVYRGLLGILWQLNIGLKNPIEFVGEYYYSNNGFTEKECEEFFTMYDEWKNGVYMNEDAALPIAISNIGGLRRHYTGTSISKIYVLEKLDASLLALYGIGSGFFTGELGFTYDLGNDLTAEITWQSVFPILEKSKDVSEYKLLGYYNKIQLLVSISF